MNAKDNARLERLAWRYVEARMKYETAISTGGRWDYLASFKARKRLDEAIIRLASRPAKRKRRRTAGGPP